MNLSKTKVAILSTVLVLPMMMFMFAIAFFQSKAIREQKEAKQVSTVRVVRIYHSDQKFFGAKVRIWDGKEENSAEFPMGTTNLSDENPHQEIEIPMPTKAEEWCFVSLSMDYGENAGRNFSFSLEKGQLKSVLTLEMDEKDKPVLRTADNTWFSDLQPERIELYTFNELFAGARISIKNEDGKVFWINFPEPPKSHDRFLDRQEWKVVAEVPHNFDLTRTYTMRIHLKNGSVSRYQFYRISTKAEPAFYLHVCSNYPAEKGNYGLRPKVLLNGVGGDVWPDRI
jgi:hypothetical protein